MHEDRLVGACLLLDGQSLSSAAGNAGGEPGGGYEVAAGDNSQNSLDGRYYGPITGDSIIGRVSRIYWPLSRIEK
ncbi:MAG: S26 family signal peptidase [Pontiella sp.]|nr:S26 family signal peptidase [Pontiella sp.]